MLSILPLVVALATVPSPGPSTRPTPLQEIGRVRALPPCTPIVVHANGAITQALDNDRGLAILATNLRAVDYDRLNVIQRRNAINAIEKQASDIRMNAGSADGEIKRLREYAVNSPDPQRKAELKAFADALGGALQRQKRAATEVMGEITVLDGRADAAEAREIVRRDTGLAETGPSRGIARAAVPAPPASLNDVMRAMASNLDDRAGAIVADEGVAADHSIAATSGC
jgi:hypothetical protein